MVKTVAEGKSSRKNRGRASGVWPVLRFGIDQRVDRIEQSIRGIRLGDETVRANRAFFDELVGNGAAHEDRFKRGVRFFELLDEFQAVHGAHDAISDEERGLFLGLLHVLQCLDRIIENAGFVTTKAQDRVGHLTQRRFVIHDVDKLFVLNGHVGDLSAVWLKGS